MLYREGDIVTMRGRVVFNQEPHETQVHVDLEGDGLTNRDAKLIVDVKALTLTRAAFKVGDKVSWGRDTGEVVAIAGEGLDALLWVRTAGGNMETFDVILCTRVDPPAAPPSMPAGGIGSWVRDEKAEFLAGGE